MLMSKMFHGAMVHVNLGHKGLNLHITNMDQTWPNTDPQLWSLELGKLWLNRSIILERCFPHRHRWKFINGPQHRASGIGLPPGPHCQHPVSPWHGCGTEFLCSLSFQGQANCVCFSQRNLGKKNKKTSIQEKPDTYWYIYSTYTIIYSIYIYMYTYIATSWYIPIHTGTIDSGATTGRPFLPSGGGETIKCRCCRHRMYSTEACSMGPCQFQIGVIYGWYSYPFTACHGLISIFTQKKKL